MATQDVLEAVRFLSRPVKTMEHVALIFGAPPPVGLSKEAIEINIKRADNLRARICAVLQRYKRMVRDHEKELGHIDPKLCERMVEMGLLKVEQEDWQCFPGTRDAAVTPVLSGLGPYATASDVPGFRMITNVDEQLPAVQRRLDELKNIPQETHDVRVRKKELQHIVGALTELAKPPEPGKKKRAHHERLIHLSCHLTDKGRQVSALI